MISSHIHAWPGSWDVTYDSQINTWATVEHESLFLTQYTELKQPYLQVHLVALIELVTTSALFISGWSFLIEYI